MSTRRTILATILGVTTLPLIGWKRIVAAIKPPAKPRSLAATRDLLLPAVYAFAAQHAPDLEFNIYVDFTADSLLVKGWSFPNKRGLGFVITKEAIQDRTYVRTFRPSMELLAKCLKRDDISLEDEQRLFGKIYEQS